MQSRTPNLNRRIIDFGRFIRAFALLLICIAFVGRDVWTSNASAKTIQLTPESDWFSVLSGPSLQPGDEVILADGVYADRRRLQISQRGTRENPIVIRGAEGARAVLRRPDRNQNTMNLVGCQYLVIQDLEITGGAAGIRIGRDGPHLAKFIALQGLHIHHVDGVAVTANFPGETYQGMRFRRNHIHHTSGHGEAFYLGSNNDADGKTTGYIFDSIIEGNYIHDLNGPGVSQGDAIELKDGSYNNIIRDNVIHDTNYPGILVYSTDGKAPNVIERNVIWNGGDHGIQAAADAIIRNNVVFDTKGDAIHCRNHQSAQVGNLQILHNTLLSKSSLRIVTPKDWSGPIVVANNAIGGELRIPNSDQITDAGNVRGVSEKYPANGSAVIGVAVSKHRSSDDFNGTERIGNDAGAYEFSNDGNPGKQVDLVPHSDSVEWPEK